METLLPRSEASIRGQPTSGHVLRPGFVIETSGDVIPRRPGKSRTRPRQGTQEAVWYSSEIGRSICYGRRRAWKSFRENSEKFVLLNHEITLPKKDLDTKEY